MSNRLNQEREEELQPKRMQSCREKLESLGFTVRAVGGDLLTFDYNGNTIKFWPYSGWHSGKGINDGRGFGKLLRQISQKAAGDEQA